MPATGLPTLQPALAEDAVVRDAAERAFSDLARAWFDAAASPGRDAAHARRAQLRQVIDLGFADALPAPGAREAWPTAATVIRAQARAAAPIDMALLLATGERDASIAEDPEAYACGGAHAAPAEPCAAQALALGRALQICAALDAALELTLRYVQDRRQFGRPLAAFQVIQHSLAVAAEQAAAAAAATDLALVRMAREGCESPRLAALLDAAAVVLGRAVDVVYDACHQAHGAIGFTREYALHRHSLNLLRWRDHLHALRGGELRSAERLGDAALQAGGVWRMVTAIMKPGGLDD
jgi:acyl-CoA dehydrogenase